MKRRRIHAGLLALAMGVALWAAAQEPTKVVSDPKPPSATVDSRSDAASRTDGEKRFRANCGRCHQAPHKFPPRMMATIVRHMRVRATLTDEDMKLILKYMTD
jgi:mono/diheme cytochrome c family protein